MTNVEDFAAKALRNRVNRLQRLLDLGSPAFVMANEAMLIMDALLLLSPEEVMQARVDREVERIRVRSHFCSSTSCDNRIESDAERAATMCASCIKETEAENEQDDLDNEQDDDEDPSAP